MRGIFLNPSEHVRHAYVSAKNQGFCIGAFLACAQLFLFLSDSAVKIMDSPQHYTLFFLFPVLALSAQLPNPQLWGRHGPHHRTALRGGGSFSGSDPAATPARPPHLFCVHGHADAGPGPHVPGHAGVAPPWEPPGDTGNGGRGTLERQQL